MIYVGYYTIGTPYEAEAAECVATLDQFGLRHDFVGVPNAGSWVRNCSLKPMVIERLMLKHDGVPLVYLDADARVRARPVWFDSIPPDIDIACHYREGHELVSGTLCFGPTVGARQLVGDWRIACQASPDEWDQQVLQRILAGDKSYRLIELPKEYIRIFDDPRMGEPVIEQMQASRRLARTVCAYQS